MSKALEIAKAFITEIANNKEAYYCDAEDALKEIEAAEKETMEDERKVFNKWMFGHENYIPNKKSQSYDLAVASARAWRARAELSRAKLSNEKSQEES